MQVYERQREVFGERAIVADDSQDAPPCAVRWDSAAATSARIAEAQADARQINFANDPTSDPASILRARDADDIAHKFVAERAVKIVIAAQDFDVGIADSSEANAHEGPARPQSRQWFLFDDNAISARSCGKHRGNIGAQGGRTGKARAKWRRLQRFRKNSNCLSF